MNSEISIDWEKAKFRINWEKSYSVGVRGIDDQHKMLLQIINTFVDAIRHNKGRSEIRSTLDSLISYTNLHFVAEEVLMGAVGYPFLPDHMRKHKLLVKQINEFSDRVSADDYVSNNEVLDFLYDWLINHILMEDMKCADIYRSKGLH